MRILLSCIIRRKQRTVRDGELKINASMSPSRALISQHIKKKTNKKNPVEENETAPMELAAEVGFLGGGFFLTFHTFALPLQCLP